jgi:hypothetical protein
MLDFRHLGRGLAGADALRRFHARTDTLNAMDSSIMTTACSLPWWPRVQDAKRNDRHLWFQVQGIDEIAAPPSMIDAINH